jgi:hypothetical protein
MNKIPSFRQIEAKCNRSVDFQAFPGLNGESILIQVEQFAQVDDHTGLRTIETGVNRSVKLLTSTTAPLTVGGPGNWIRQSRSAPIRVPIHDCHHINSGSAGKGAR